jgi:hypothetical protein
MLCVVILTNPHSAGLQLWAGVDTAHLVGGHGLRHRNIFQPLGSFDTHIDSPCKNSRKRSRSDFFFAIK